MRLSLPQDGCCPASFCLWSVSGLAGVEIGRSFVYQRFELIAPMVLTRRCLVVVPVVGRPGVERLVVRSVGLFGPLP